MIKQKPQQNCSKRKVSKLANGFRKPEADFYLLTGYYSSLLVFGLVTSFFWEISVSELSGFCVFLEDESTDLREKFFQGLEENT